MFLIGKVHLLGGLVGTLSAMLHVFHFICRPTGALNSFTARTTALVCFVAYAVNNAVAIPMLFTVHGQLSSLVRLLATGLFINVVLLCNGICILFGQRWPLVVAFPMAALGVLYSLAEISVGWLGSSPTVEERRQQQQQPSAWLSFGRFGPLAALLQKGARPAAGFFKETAVISARIICTASGPSNFRNVESRNSRNPGKLNDNDWAREGCKGT